MDRRNGVGRMVAAGDEFDGEWAADAPHGEGATATRPATS